MTRTTHHNACLCREAKFTDLQKAVERLREAARYLASDRDLQLGHVSAETVRKHKALCDVLDVIGWVAKTPREPGAELLSKSNTESLLPIDNKPDAPKECEHKGGVGSYQAKPFCKRCGQTLEPGNA
jgi:hypothetical protein